MNESTFKNLAVPVKLILNCGALAKTTGKRKLVFNIQYMNVSREIRFFFFYKKQFIHICFSMSIIENNIID